MKLQTALSLAIACGLLLAPSDGAASTISFAPTDLVASVHTRGQYDNASLGTWNGQPLSPSNQPTFEQDQLSADWNFYVNSATPNELFVEAFNVQDTAYGSIFGAPFDLVALTGFDFTLAIVGGGPLAAPGFSNDWARPGEGLNGRPSLSDPAVQVPLTDTPNWNLALVGPSEFRIATADVNYGFSHFGNIFGATRIVGGGVVELIFDPTVDLLSDVDFRELTAVATHGLGAYDAEGTVTFAIAPEPVPEPASLLLLATGLAVVRSRRLFTTRSR